MSKIDHTVYFVLPAYDEAARIQETMLQLERGIPSEWRSAWVVVDDGSTDATAQAARAAGARVLEMGARIGPGAAILRGLRWASERASPTDRIVVAESDGTSDPRIVARLVAALEDADIAIASRWIEGGGADRFPLLRRFFSRTCNWLFQRLRPFGSVRDYTNFFRAYRRDILLRGFPPGEDHELREPGFAGNAEILLHLAAHGARITEVPFVYSYGAAQRPSRMRVLGTMAGHLRLLVAGPAHHRAGG